MDLKIKDVADLLNVSETTIRRWVSGGQIPAYRLNHRYRFSRMEIENWMVGRKLNDSQEPESRDPLDFSPTKAGTRQFSLFRALHKGEVLTRISASSKEEIIRAGAEVASAKLGLDRDLLVELLLDREQLMSTALGHGVAVPHPREFIVKGQGDLVIAVFPERPVDFDSLDGSPVHSFFFLFSSEDKTHLQLLAKIAHLSSRSEARDLFSSKPDKDALMSFIRGWEGKIQN